MRSEHLAAEIERDLVQAAVRAGFFDRQIPAGRGPIVDDIRAEVEVCFKIREAGTRASGRPDAYVVLREMRTVAATARPTWYWYGLVERLEPGGWRYEGYHCHDEPWAPDQADVHRQVDIRDDEGIVGHQVLRVPTRRVHVVRAIESLTAGYYERLAGRLGDAV